MVKPEKWMRITEKIRKRYKVMSKDGVLSAMEWCEREVERMATANKGATVRLAQGGMFVWIERLDAECFRVEDAAR